MRSLAPALVHLFLMLTLAVVSAPVTSAAVAGVAPTSAPWVHIVNIKDNLYHQVANFALMIQALVFKDYLDLVEVVDGSTQVAGVGKNYNLLLRATDKNATVGRYNAVVWGVAGSRDWPWKVISFRRVAGN